jgi:tetratricopeptide (TPR) repeat protein
MSGQYDNALNYYFESFELAQLTADSSVIRQLLMNTGIAYYKLKNYNKALGYYLEYLAFHKDEQSVPTIAFTNISLCYTFLGDFINARVYLQKVMDACAGGCIDQSMMHMAYAKGCLGIRSDRTAEAEANFLASYELAKGDLDDRMQLDNIYYLSGIYMEQNRFTEASTYLQKGERVINTGSPYNLEALKIYTRLYQFYSLVKDPNRVSYYQGKYIALRDSIYNERLTTNLMRIESEFEQRGNVQLIAKQTTVLELQAEVIEKQRLLTVATALLGIISLAFLILSYKNIRQKRELNLLLQKKVEERTLELQKSRDELIGALTEKEIKISRVYQEIRETMNSIIGLCTVGMSETTDPKASRYFKKIMDATNTLFSRQWCC